MREDKPAFTERRRKPDWMVRGATILSVISWLLTIFVVLILDIASPNQENMFTHYFGGMERAVWNEGFILVAYIFLILSMASCLTAFVFNMLRKRRKTDKYKKSVIIIGVITVIGFIAFMLRFGGQLF
jgi:heme/copper-type cytochrome/quinol oxidase subunit 2